MVDKLFFGDHKGKTIEWLFFNDPWYVRWLIREQIYENPRCFNRQQRDYLLELYRRASHLDGGTCDYCQQRPLTRLVVHKSRQMLHHITGIASCCNHCDYFGGVPVEYFIPSFFLPDEKTPRCQQLWIVEEIRRIFMPRQRLTQKQMERFFRRDDIFPIGTPGFFDQIGEGHNHG